MLYIALIAAIAMTGGCGDPDIFSLTGKVTLDGKPYERLIVYFDPIGRKVDAFHFGVGETDAEGNLTLRSSAGPGLAAGKYRVSFNCLIQEKASPNTAVGLSDKDESINAVVPVELVPEPYNDRQKSPVEFTIRKADNVFEYDIPGK
jgi:hypothetical protein